MTTHDPTTAQQRTVGQVMRPYAPCICEDLTLAQAAQLLVDWKLTAVTVCDEDGAVAGIVTDRDLARAVAEDEDPWMLDATAMRTRPNQDPSPLHPQEPLHDGLAALVRHQLWHLPVTLNGQPVGTLYLADILAPWTGAL
jgi:CBS domain-containing protein